MSRPPGTSAPMPPVRTTAGWTGGISAPMAIPMADAGASSVSGLQAAFPGDTWHAVSRQAGGSGQAGVGDCGAGRRPRYPRRGPGFETDPNTVLRWLVEAADHLEAFSRHFLRDIDVEQVQMDELFALLSAVKDGEVSERQAIKRLSRSPHWVGSRWTPCASSSWRSTSAIGPWPWRNAWSIRSPRCWRRTVPRCF